MASGQATISSGTSRPSGFAAGDEIVIINLKGNSADYANVGLYEYRKILTLPTSTSITVNSNLTNAYNGTTQKVVVQRVPNYTDVTVNSGQTMSANAWDGTSGGVIAFRSSGTITINSGTSISANGLGFRGGSAGTAYTSNAQNGEWAGGGMVASGGAYNQAGISSLGGGGGGAGGNNASSYAGSAGTVGSAGGGAGACHTGTTMTSCTMQGVGGNGGYGTEGRGGGSGMSASNGSGSTGGAGAASFASTYPQTGSGGGGGTVGDSTSLNQRAYLGSDGGARGGYYTTSYGSSTSLAGGIGGGLILIGANVLVNSGTISSNATATTSNGSGGSVVILAKSGTNGGTISAVGKVEFGTIYTGNGRAYIGYTSFSGLSVTGAVLYSIGYGYQSPATIGGTVAGNVGLKHDAGSGLRVQPTSLSWTTATTLTGQNVKFKVRAGNNQTELDANQCYGTSTLDSGCADWTTAGKFFTTTVGTTGGTNVVIPAAIGSKRYIEVLVRLESNGSNTPTLNDVTLNYDSLESPVNASTNIKKTDNSFLKDSAGTTITAGTAGGWTNETTA